MNTSLFLTGSHLSPNLAITIFASFAVYVHNWIPKQLPPSALPLFTKNKRWTLLGHGVYSAEIKKNGITDATSVESETAQGGSLGMTYVRL